MRISVIVAVYNIEKYIAKCIESIINQSYRDLEIILVDDGSTDRSGKICDDYAEKDNRIKVIHRENGGPGSARNTGLDCAKGEYIAFVDGDDWLEKEMYATLMRLCIQYEADVVACRYRCVYKEHQTDASSGVLTIFDTEQEMLIQCLKADEKFLIQQAVWNKLWKKDILADNRFPERKWCGEDAIFTIKALSKVRKGVYLDRALYNYFCERDGSIMNEGMTERNYLDIIYSNLEKERILLELDREEPVQIHRYFFYKRLLEIYRMMFRKEGKMLKKYRTQLIQILKERKSTFQDVYRNEIAIKTEKIKMKIFIFCPFAFRIFMNLNDRVILPVRLKRMARKR